MRKLTMLLIATMAILTTMPLSAAGGTTYEVTVTNLTPGQSFTPLLLATHMNRISLFQVGHEASEELELIAEGGDIGPLMMMLANRPKDVLDVQASAGLLGPGESVTVEIVGNHLFNRLSLVGMLIPTNDSIVAINATKLAPSKQLTVPAYDAGTEFNDELCENIPGPVCGGAGLSMEDGEGFIHISGGISGHGDLDPGAYDWRNPVAHVEIRRKR
jgi:hypothetical protein